MIAKDEVLELLDEALARLPEELRAARWLLKEREEFLARTRHEGDEILDQARSRAERMVQRTEVVKAAEHRACQIIDTAEAEARRLRHEVRGLLRPEAGQLRDRARAHDEAGGRRPREAAGPNLLATADETHRLDLPPRPTAATERLLRPRHGDEFFDQDDASCAWPAPAPVVDVVRAPAPPRRRARACTRRRAARRAVDARPRRCPTTGPVAHRPACSRRSAAASSSTGTVPCAVAGRLPPLPRAGRGRGRRPRSRRSSSATRPRARPTRSPASTSTSSRWSATPCCWPCRWPRCAGPTARARPRAVPHRRRPTTSAATRDPRWAALDEPHVRPAAGPPSSALPSDGWRRPLRPEHPAPATLSRRVRRRARGRRRRADSHRHHRGIHDHGRPQEEDLQGQEPQPPGLGLDAEGAGRAASARAAAPTKLPHVVCGNCGWYHGRQAIDVD